MRRVIGPLEFIGLVIAVAASTVCLVYWTAVGIQILRTRRLIPTARAGLRLPADSAARVCVIVPAHNEGACIGDLARSLIAQDQPNLSCVFVLDRCTDDTRSVIERTWANADRPGGPPSLEIIEIDSCPPDWSGKSHALWRAVNQSRAAQAGDLLLFVDADTWLDHGLVRATVALLRQRRSRMLSLLSTLTHDRWFEVVVQPAASMELMRQYPIIRANAGSTDRRRAFANGQFILIERSAYMELGGHESIRGEVLEDVMLARRCQAAGMPVSLLLSDGLLRCRMYDSFEAFTRGWRRIYSESANRKPTRLRSQAARVRLLGTVLPLLSLAAFAAGIARLDGPHPHLASLAIWFGGLGSVAYGVAVLLIYHTGRSPLWTAPGFIVGCWITGGILRHSAADLEAGRPINWAGREYVQTVRR